MYIEFKCPFKLHLSTMLVFKSRKLFTEKKKLYPKFIWHLNFYQNKHANYFSFDCFLGTIGFFACFWFVTKIYGVVKVD